ncbi:hypothetical protein EV182_003674, partial [Spiromyces aspiralis]
AIPFDEWKRGLEKYQCTDNSRLEALILSHKQALSKDKKVFRDMYKWAFGFLVDPEEKKMRLEVFKYVVPHLLGENTAHVKPFLTYLDYLEANPQDAQKSKNILYTDKSDTRPKNISKDQWQTFYTFINVVKDDQDFTGYDPNLSSWPVVFDDYIGWRKSGGYEKFVSQQDAD